ncbi:MAG: Gx transporter family protein [Eubacteriales bacterium]|nr:Gx transporter family protein [Eubacteriales bacterium]
MKRNRTKNKSLNIRILTLTALLSSLAIVLSFLEGLLPDLPFVIPGMKLGLSNIVIMFSLEILPLPSALIILGFKALFALFTRGAAAGLLSFCGGLLSTLAMYLLVKSRKPQFGSLGIGITGAFFHNFGQLVIAYLIVSKGILPYIPVLCVFSLLTGALTGLVNSIILPAVSRIPYFEDMWYLQS